MASLYTPTSFTTYVIDSYLHSLQPTFSMLIHKYPSKAFDLGIFSFYKYPVSSGHRQAAECRVESVAGTNRRPDRPSVRVSQFERSVRGQESLLGGIRLFPGGSPHVMDRRRRHRLPTKGISQGGFSHIIPNRVAWYGAPRQVNAA